MVQTGIMRLKNDNALQQNFKGNVALLCHSASIDENYKHSLEIMLDIYKDRLVKVFGPQHGFVTDVQDNMIETDHTTHPHFNLPIYSLYSETRIPTDEMLEGIDHLFIDLQDVGTRIYTYIYTMTHILEKCADKDIEIIILDRPNPINAKDVEGNILDTKFASFVGRHELPVRHALTMGEVALMHQKYWAQDKCKLTIIEMENYQRDQSFFETGLPYVNPSPNLSTVEGCYTFAGTVIFEGTNISEGRGTTRALEQVGFPGIEPWGLKPKLDKIFKELNLTGFELRACNFHPMFQKHAGVTCGGFFIHPTNLEAFKPWRVSQVLLKEIKQHIGDKFSYKTDAYEYGDGLNPMDMVNGDDRFRQWYDSPGDYGFLERIEAEKLQEYLNKRETILIYK